MIRARTSAPPRLLLLALLAGALLGADRPAPGVYCPLPKGDAPPKCLGEARAHYGDFFAGLEGGVLDDEAVARLEADISEGDAPRAYDALSAMTFAYYLLSRRAALTEDPDPEVAPHLERWNELFSRTYAASEDDPHYREAVRTAAFDLRERAPAVRLTCRAPDGAAVPCDSTDAVVRGMSEMRDTTGLRGAITRLVERVQQMLADPPAEETP